MVCVGKTERDCCAPLPEIDFLGGCVSVTRKICLIERVFLPLRVLGRAQAAEETCTFFPASLVIIPKPLLGKESGRCCRALGHILFCTPIPSLPLLCKLPLFLFKPLSSWDQVFQCPFHHEQFISISSMLARSCSSCKFCSPLFEIKTNQSLNSRELSRGHFLMDLEKY